MSESFCVINLENVEIPMSFFEDNLVIKTKINNLFERNDTEIINVLHEIRKKAKKYNRKFANLSFRILVDRFKYYFYKGICYKAIINSFTSTGSMYSVEKNIENLLTDENLMKAVYGIEMYNTFQSISLGM